MPDGLGKYIEELWVGIKADYSSLQAGLKQAQNEVKGFANKLGESSEQMRKFGQTTTIVAGAFAGIGYLLNSVFADFEQSMANTYSVLGATKKEMDELEKYARKMGETTIFKASQAADAMYYLASAGYNANQVMGALKGTLDLAAATQYDLAETTRVVVSALNAFQLDATEATRVANVFSAVISGSQATMDRLADSMKYVAPIANQLNISIEQTSAALGLLYNSGIAASQAGTYLRQGLVRLQKPTAEAQQAILSMGLSLDDVNPQFHSLTEIIRNFEKAGAGAIDKGDELAAIFDVRSAGAFQVLIKQGADALDILETKITGTSKASEMADTQINTFKGSMKLLESAIQETAIQIGEALQPVLRAIQLTLTNLVKVFNAIPQPIKQTATMIIFFATALGLVVGPVAMLIAKMPVLIASVTTLGTAFWTAMGAVGAVTVAIGYLVAIVSIYSNRVTSSNTALSDGVKKLQEYNDKQIQQKTKMAEVIKAYTDLGNKQNKTTADTENQKKAYDKIKALYPSLISSTDDYKTALSKMNTVLDDTNSALKTAYENKAKLRQLELRIDVSKAKQDLRDLNKQIDDQSVTSLLIPQINTQQQLPEIVKLGDVLKSTFSDVGETINNKGVFALNKMGEKVESLINSTDGVNRLYEDSGRLLGKINELEFERETILTRQKEAGGKLETSDENKLYYINKSITALESISSLYTQTLETGQNQLQLQTDIIEKEQELEDIKKNGLKIPDKITPPKGTPDGALTDEEKQRTQQLEREIYELKKKSLENQLSMLEKHKDDSYEADMKYLDKKREIEQADLDFYVSQQKQKLVELKANQSEIDKVDKLGIETKLANDEKYNSDKDAVDEKWFRIHQQKLENQYKYGVDLSKQDLQNWIDTLEKKKVELEAKGKIYTDEWASIVAKINETTSMIDAPDLNKMKFDMEQFSKGVSGYEDGTALDAYANYLQEQLGLYQEWSDEYLNILLQLEDVKDQIRDRELEKNRVLFLSIKDMADVALSGIQAGMDFMWNRYIIGARKAKNEMDAIWLAIKNAVLKALLDIVQAEITKMFLKIITSAFGPIGSSIGGFLGGLSGPGTVATGVDGISNSGVENIAATGAYVLKSGSLKVHKDETVVPARITRKNSDDYVDKYFANLSDAFTKIPISPQTNKSVEMDKNMEKMMEKVAKSQQNINVTINNPIVNDERYWEKLSEEYIKPAFSKTEKRFGDK